MLLAYLKSALINTPIYSFWASVQSRRQRECFDRLMDRIQQAESTFPSLSQALESRRSERRAISNIPHVLALGHDSWEQYGLWPSLQKIAKFNFYAIGKLNHIYDPAMRCAEGRRILAFVDEMERQGTPFEIVFIYADASFLSSEMLEGLSTRKIWTVLMGLDDKHRLEFCPGMGMFSGQALVAPLVDIYWTTWKMAIPYLWKIGARPIYLAEGADPAFHRKLPMKRDIDILFLGSCYGVRKSLIEYLEKRGLNVSAYGSGWSNGYVNFEKSIELINRSKVVLGIGGVGHMSSVQHLKGRDFEVPMCGALYLTSYNPELTDWYDIGREILCYSSPQNCAEILGIILRDESLQESIRRAALARAQKDHTWEGRILSIFHLLGGDFDCAK